MRHLTGIALLARLTEAREDARAANKLLRLVEREVRRRRPKKIAYYFFDEKHCAARFALATVSDWNGCEVIGTRRNAHPVKPSTRGGKFPPVDSRVLDAWFRRHNVSHVIVTQGDSTTSNECIASGRHKRAAFVRWYGLLEDED